MPTQVDTDFLAAQEQHRKLLTQVTRLEVEIESAAKQVSLLEAEAMRLFDTSDLPTLQTRLATKTAANEAKKLAFTQSVSRLGTELAALQAANVQ